MSIYGYFDNAAQLTPAYDPGLNVVCPICAVTVSEPLKTISLMVPTKDGHWPERSYFYRTHKDCYDRLDGAGKTRVDGLLIDAICSARNTN